MGVPLTYTEELGEEICLKLSTDSKSIITLCRENKHWPCYQTIYEWRIKVPSFGDMYSRAKQNQIEILVDQILDISDDQTHDTITRTTNSGDEYDACNSEWINRSRLRVDSRKWLAAKLAPRIYGESKADKGNEGDAISQFRVENE